jgi:Glycosyltransferase family 92
MRNYLSLCCIFKDEAPYLEEWLRFYDLVGVDHFYLYDNQSSDGFAPVLAPWVNAGRATVMGISGPAPQKKAYAHCLQTFANDNRWIAFLDMDEFLFSPMKESLKELLLEYETQPGVVANWVMFGPSGHQTKPAGLTTLNYTMRCDTNLRVIDKQMLRSLNMDPADPQSYFLICSHVKSIVDPRKVVSVQSPHHFKYVDDQVPVTAGGQPLVLAPFTFDVQIDRLRVNHYFSRSWEELSRKLSRGRSDIVGKYDPAQMIERTRMYDVVPDTTIFPLGLKVQSAMGSGVASRG